MSPAGLAPPGAEQSGAVDTSCRRATSATRAPGAMASVRICGRSPSRQRRLRSGPDDAVVWPIDRSQAHAREHVQGRSLPSPTRRDPPDGPCLMAHGSSPAMRIGSASRNNPRKRGVGRATSRAEAGHTVLQSSSSPGGALAARGGTADPDRPSAGDGFRHRTRPPHRPVSTGNVSDDGFAPPVISAHPASAGIVK